MNLQRIIYFSIFLIVSCIEPTLPPEIDCNNVIGGDASFDVCGYCTGGATGLTFNYLLGCDSTCIGKQNDCSGECGGSMVTDCDSNCITIDLEKKLDHCGECGGDDSTCSGCTDTTACNYDPTATVYSSCDLSNFYCEFDSEGPLLDLSSFDKNCSEIDEAHYCGPGADACKFVDCNDTINFGYIDRVIDCNRKLPDCDTLFTDGGGIDELVCVNYQDYVGDLLQENGGCDFTITNCAEFNFDGGDCDLVDCRGTHFSEEYCISIFGYSCITGDSSWLGDGTCDKGENENELGLNFDCALWNYDGGDCEIPSRRLGK